MNENPSAQQQEQPVTPPVPPTAKAPPANGTIWQLVVLFAIVIAISIFGLLSGGSFTGGKVSRKEVEKIVADYIADNPQAIIDSVENMQRKRTEEDVANAKENIVKYKDELVNDATDPVVGNPNGDVTLVEFFDYSCGFCKRVQPEVEKLLAEDKSLRVVMKEFPILGPVSEIASRAALAVYHIQPDKYWEFHNTLMKEKLADKDGILAVAEKMGIDKAKLSEAMDDNKISEKIQKNHELAGKIGIRGTPGFIVGDTLIPGALTYEQLASLIKTARNK